MDNQDEAIIDEVEDIEDIQAELELLEEANAEAAASAAASGKESAKAHDPMAILYKYHPEAILDYSEQVAQKLAIRAAPPNIASQVDENHTTQPFLSQYEKTSILGFRTNQLSQGARPFVSVPPHITSTFEIAKMELEQRRLPLIVKRPMPDGTFEYWRLSDLMVI